MNLLVPDSGLLFWMVLVFGIVFFILAKFGFPIITDMVDKRNAHIRNSLDLARQAEERMQQLSQEQNRLLEETRQEQGRLLSEATQARRQILEQARTEAREEADKILSQARVEIAAEKESALRDIRKEMSMLGVSIAEKVVRKELHTDAAQMEYIDRLGQEMTGQDDTSHPAS